MPTTARRDRRTWRSGRQRGLAANPADARGLLPAGRGVPAAGAGHARTPLAAPATALHRLRQLQAINAFAAAAERRPDSPGLPTAGWARLYRDAGSLDLPLRHLDGLIRATRARGGDVAGLEDERATLARQVQLSEQEAIGDGKRPTSTWPARRPVGARPTSPCERCWRRTTRSSGRYGHGCNWSCNCGPAGRATSAPPSVPELQPALGTLAYLDLLAGLAVATGDYAAADRHLAAVAHTLGLAPGGKQPGAGTDGARRRAGRAEGRRSTCRRLAWCSRPSSATPCWNGPNRGAATWSVRRTPPSFAG
ncbi:MAG: hypothetical protein U0736_05805 [Gemmataceae bacterium]